MKHFFMLLTLFYALTLPAQAESRLDGLKAQVMSIRQKSFPELEGVTIDMQWFSEEDSFFQSNLYIDTLFSDAVRYKIEVNPELFQKGCPPDAVEAILAHELSHTLDYHKGGVWGLLQIVNWLRWYPDLVRYEHRTDLQAIFRSYGPGLIAYRNWIYTVIPKEDLARKQEVYYEPHEIKALMYWRDRAREQGIEPLLFQRFFEKPPLDIYEIESRACQLFNCK